MPLPTTGALTLEQIRAYWASKGQAAATRDMNWYRGKAHYVGVMPSDSAANATFSAGAITLADFYNKTPVGEGAAVNCNCNCDCAGGSGCGSSCFPAGAMVLAAGGNWREITQLRIGDMLMTPDGPRRIERLIRTNLGDRRMMSFHEDQSLRWSEEHAFLVRRGNSSWLWSMAPRLLENEFLAGILGGHIDRPAWLGQIDGAEEIAHLDGFVSRRPMQVPDDPDTQLYLPIVEDGQMIIVNGYVVNSNIDGALCAYDRIGWNGIAQAEHKHHIVTGQTAHPSLTGLAA